MTKSKVLIAICLGLLAGVGVGSVYSVPARVGFVLLAVAAASLGVYVYREKISSASKPAIIFLAVAWLLGGVGLGLVRIEQVRSEQNQFVEWFGSKQDFEGVIVTEPDVRTDKQLLTVQPKRFSQRVLVTTTLATTYFYGDEVWVRGKVTQAEVFDDFDYPGYLARFHTFALVRYPKISVLASNKGNAIIGFLLGLKRDAVQFLQKRYVEPEGSLLLGILIGAKRGLPKEVTDNFIRAGTSHVVAASGFNITILLTGLGFLAYAIGRRAQLVVSLICILSFVVIAGPSASVLRATCMGLLVMLSIASGRLYNPLPSLLLAAGAMVFFNPRILYWDVGFQLSALATAGIVLGMPFVELLKEKLGWVYPIVAALGVTLCAIVATVPVSLWQFGQISVIAPVSNMLMVPLIAPVMALGGLSFLPFIGVGFVWVNTYLLSWMLHVAQWSAGLEWSTVAAEISGRVVIITYVLIIGIYFLLYRRLLRN